MSLEEAKAQIDRDECIANNIDALGKRWRIKHIAHTSLYTVRPEPDREDAQIPKVFQGKYTSPDKAQAKIDLHLDQSWNHAEVAQAKAAGKAAVASTSKSIDVGLSEAPSEEAKAEEDAAIADILGVEETTEE